MKIKTKIKTKNKFFQFATLLLVFAALLTEKICSAGKSNQACRTFNIDPDQLTIQCLFFQTNRFVRRTSSFEPPTSSFEPPNLKIVKTESTHLFHQKMVGNVSKLPKNGIKYFSKFFKIFKNSQRGDP